VTGWLADKAALVTGGASGIGRAVVERFLAEGARVCVLDRAPDLLTPLVETHGGNLVVAPGSVTTLADNQRAVDLAVATFGRLDVFVGNAGIFDYFARLVDLPADAVEQAFDEVFAVNVKGYLLGAKATAPHLQASGGNMVFTVSNAGFYPDGGGPIYTASKHAVVGLIRELAFELAPTVRVNGVAPGGTMTALTGPPSLSALGAGRLTGAAREAMIRQRNPLQLAQQPADHAAVYLLLASDQARAITGAVIPSDGGIGVRGMSGPAG
jgi:NAD(P)-dependent dehydrogenase (short-subunit alcohol dehydrogenase family)